MGGKQTGGHLLSIPINGFAAKISQNGTFFLSDLVDEGMTASFYDFFMYIFVNVGLARPGGIMRYLKTAFVLFLCLVVWASATHVAVLETGADPAAKDLVSLSNRQYLTNVLREEAVKQLPAVQNYTIMTRENINAMLPPGKSIEDCEGSCLAETGKNIAADYICQARVGSFDGMLTLSAELYETAGNKLMASFNGRGANLSELLDLIKQKAPDFFRSIKGNSTGFSGVGGIGEVGGAGGFSYGGKKKYIVEIASSPAGAVPTIDGKAVPKCLSTPCKVQVEEGSHRIVMSKDRYDDAEAVVEIKANYQKVGLTLAPNFGFLDVRPVLGGQAANRGKLNIAVDGNRVKETKVLLDPGVHSVRLTHPCYDPAEFKVTIAKNKTEVFDQAMMRGKGGLELNAEYNGEPQAVAVFIDGVESGSTPYSGEIPLCAEVMLKGSGWSEKVDVRAKWHEVVQVTHRLKHAPEGVAMADDTRARANAAYDELDGKQGAGVGESIPANVESEESGVAGKVVLGIGVAASVTGVILAVVGNSNAKDAAETEKFANQDEFNDARDKAKSGQTLRSVGIGLAIVGAVGIGVSFAF